MNELNLYSTLDDENYSLFENEIEFSNLTPSTDYEMHFIGKNKNVEKYSEGWKYTEFRDFLNYQFKTLPDNNDIRFIIRNETHLEISTTSDVVALHVNGQERKVLKNEEIFDFKHCHDATIKITTKNGSPYTITSKRLTTCECPLQIREVPITYEIDKKKSALKLSWKPIWTNNQNKNILCGVKKYVVIIDGDRFQTSETFFEISLCDVFHTEDVIVQGISYEGLTLSNSSAKITLLKVNKVEKINVTFIEAKLGNQLEAKVLPIPNESFMACKFSIVPEQTALQIKPIHEFNSKLPQKHKSEKLDQCSTYNLTVYITLNDKHYQTRNLTFLTPVGGK